MAIAFFNNHELFNLNVTHVIHLGEGNLFRKITDLITIFG